MKLFFTYLKQKRRTLLALLIFAVIFGAVFALYRLPLRAVIYPTGICAALGALFLAVGYSRFIKLHGTLETLKTLTAETISDLPQGDIISDDYADIIRSLQSEVCGVKNADELKYTDTVDYYTVWAHQIKTPIAAMKLTLQNEDSELSRRLYSELFRVEQYVEMALAFLRLDSPQSDYVFRKCALDDVIKSSLRRFAQEFILRRIALKYNKSNRTLVTDEKWLAFVIEQILSNSLKYTKSGGISIYEKDDCLCISDSGIGIEPQDLPRVFEKGYTGCNGRADKSASGLGLYLCRRICDNLGIGISITSEVGKGTTVTLDLSQKNVRAE